MCRSCFRWNYYNDEDEKAGVQVKTEKGKEGLYASFTRSKSLFISTAKRPLMMALDTPRLSDTCYYCHKLPTQFEGLPVVGKSGESREKLRPCSECGIVRFCSTVSL